MKRVRLVQDGRHGDRIAILMGNAEHVITVRQAADLASEIQQEVVTYVSGTLQDACDRKEQTTWRERAITALRARGGIKAPSDFLTMVLKTPKDQRGAHLRDVEEGDDGLGFCSDRDLALLVKEHRIEVEGSFR